MYVDVISICVQSVALLLVRVRFQPEWCVLLEERICQGIFVEIVCVLRFQYPTICRWKV